MIRLLAGSRPRYCVLIADDPRLPALRIDAQGRVDPDDGGPALLLAEGMDLVIETDPLPPVLPWTRAALIQARSRAILPDGGFVLTRVVPSPRAGPAPPTRWRTPGVAPAPASAAAGDQGSAAATPAGTRSQNQDQDQGPTERQLMVLGLGDREGRLARRCGTDARPGRRSPVSAIALALPSLADRLLPSAPPGDGPTWRLVLVVGRSGLVQMALANQTPVFVRQGPIPTPLATPPSAIRPAASSNRDTAARALAAEARTTLAFLRRKGLPPADPVGLLVLCAEAAPPRTPAEPDAKGTFAAPFAPLAHGGPVVCLDAEEAARCLGLAPLCPPAESPDPHNQPPENQADPPADPAKEAAKGAGPPGPPLAATDRLLARLALADDLGRRWPLSPLPTAAGRAADGVALHRRRMGGSGSRGLVAGLLIGTLVAAGASAGRDALRARTLSREAETARQQTAAALAETTALQADSHGLIAPPPVLRALARLTGPQDSDPRDLARRLRAALGDDIVATRLTLDRSGHDEHLTLEVRIPPTSRTAGKAATPLADRLRSAFPDWAVRIDQPQTDAPTPDTLTPDTLTLDTHSPPPLAPASPEDPAPTRVLSGTLAGPDRGAMDGGDRRTDHRLLVIRLWRPLFSEGDAAPSARPATPPDPPPPETRG